MSLKILKILKIMALFREFDMVINLLLKPYPEQEGPPFLRPVRSRFMGLKGR
jgi:hypothetical protein